MTTLLAQAFDNLTTTLNGNPAFKSTLNRGLDLFSSIGAFRKDDPNLISAFNHAIESDKELALRILLWSRDCRGGAGRRDPIKTLLPKLAKSDPDLTTALLPKVVELGRWDDILVLHDCGVPKVWNAVVSLISLALEEEDGLCAKWMPRKGYLAAKLRRSLGLSPKAYRKTLVRLTDVVENKMCKNEWHDITYEHVPSVAFARYRKAFTRHDPHRFDEFLDRAIEGDVKIHADAVYPHDILRGAHYAQHTDKAQEAQWANLPNYLENTDERILCMVDVSSSMTCRASGSVRCMDISVALGLYISERLEGKFKNQVLTFESNPHWVSLEGSLAKRFETMRRARWGGSTNFDGAMERILEVAVQHQLSQSEMPTMLLCLSDMQFNRAGKPMGQKVKELYAKHGYTMPKLVFWNLRDYGNKPAIAGEENIIQVSGWSPAILTAVLEANTDFEVPDPPSDIEVMLNTVMKERYNIPYPV